MEREINVKHLIENILVDVGVPANLSGFRYAVKAIEMVVENPNMVCGVTKVIYPDVAKHFGSTASRVERAIRHAVKTAWVRGDAKLLYRMFGNTVDHNKGKPTNSEFISRMAQIVAHKTNSGG